MRPHLRFFRELRVSEPRLTPHGSRSTYTFVKQDGARHEVELAYRYDVPVHREPDAAAKNLARVHHSTAAINYGLFCERMAFDFPLTRADLEHHAAMMDVTAREQYLTRFVRDAPHPLLLPEYHVPPDEFEPDAVSALAEVVCDVEEEPVTETRTDPERYAVLSSGGKESLFTYGVLRELGKEAFPFYVNESGRHWHTAVTSYRHHVRTEPRTRRVWTTVDRLYTAVNRLLPCVRSDFQRIAADVYPMQLHTFASYQLAGVTLARHEGAGMLLMGNEFDEGPWPEVKGVRHYFGIHDQSQEYDVRASAHYARKGWGVRQSSLVRSLSSLVIQDMLVARYPDLAATQTSCHATHVKDGVVRPCGRCSKCLGVLLFLAAAGHDAARLRHAPMDGARLAERLAKTHIKVDQAEAEHALHLAVMRGFVFEASANGFEPRAHPEVEAVRFHPEMSRRDNLPPELSKEAYALFLERATALLVRESDAWLEIKAWSDRPAAP